MNKNNKLVYFILLVIFILLLLFPYKSEESTAFKLYNGGILEPIKNGDNVVEEFVSDDNYNYIGLTFANYGRIIEKGYFFINIQEETGKTKNYKVRANSVFDNSTFFIKYKLKKNKRYKLSLKNCSSDEITLYTTEAKIDGARLLNTTENKNLILSFKKSKKDYKLIWYYLMFISIYFSIKSLNIGGKNEK